VPLKVVPKPACDSKNCSEKKFDAAFGTKQQAASGITVVFSELLSPF
jgi:hypothetical protein